jgi:hypothetical protein
MVKLIIYALLAYIAFHFVRRFLAGLGVAPAAKAKRPAEEARQADPSRIEAQDLVRCAVCGSYVAGRCARTNCPQ